MSRKILYIVGAPRSGSKLLRELLGKHPQVVFTTHETEFLPYLLTFQKQHTLTNSTHFQRFVEYLKLEDYCFFRRMDGFDPPDWQAWFERLQAASGAEPFALFLEQELQVADTSLILGDKSPSYVFHLEEILERSPAACVVHLVRDPRAQAESEKRVFGKSAQVSATRWQRAVDSVGTARARHPERVLDIRYEDLVSDPEGTLTLVCDMLGIQFDQSMTTVDRDLERYRKPSQAPAIHPPRADAYLQNLSAAEIADVCSVCSAGMQRYGYTVVSDGAATTAPPTLALGWGLFIGRLRFAVLTVSRHGVGALLRKMRLKRARARVLAGTW